jgi:hypothetical protein
VLSSRYGLVEPDKVIEPYDYTLNHATREERKVWAEQVIAQLTPHLCNHMRIVMLAGAHYREYLIAPLQHKGILVETPMQHMRRGEQLGWLSELE